MDERGIEDAVVMDQKTFKSLTSETRTAILKLLKKRNHTISEIAQKLKISKTTAKEHIDILVEGRLVEPVPSTNIWKYYTLTKDGKKLVGEEGPKRVVITLVTFVLGFLLSVYGFSGFFSLPAGQVVTADERMLQAPAAGGAESFDAEKAVAPMAVAEETAYADSNVAATAAVQTAGEMRAPEADYTPLVLGIAGVALMTIALIMILRGRKERSVI